MISEKELEKLEELLCDEARGFIKKGSLTAPNEAQTIKYLVESLKLVQDLKMCCSAGIYDQNDYGYSGTHMHNRIPTSYNGTVDFNGSYGRRSPSTGRYMSSYSRGYSGHSIHDRMISALEGMFDNAKSQHEADEIEKWIVRLREEN